MKTRVTLDKTGRIVIPRWLRKQLRREPGDALEIKRVETQIILRPIRGQGRLRTSTACGCFTAERPCPAPSGMTLEQAREERDAANPARALS